MARVPKDCDLATDRASQLCIRSASVWHTSRAHMVIPKLSSKLIMACGSDQRVCSPEQQQQQRRSNSSCQHSNLRDLEDEGGHLIGAFGSTVISLAALS